MNEATPGPACCPEEHWYACLVWETCGADNCPGFCMLVHCPCSCHAGRACGCGCGRTL
ncbi:hypothetical protein [Streptomyces sp. NPDC059080]|uniref:hypothetical protein n=1 Tax=Streptomyces sp. NPDC059080 TaxID=3346718 RepID=UPI0036951E0E